MRSVRQREDRLYLASLPRRREVRATISLLRRLEPILHGEERYRSMQLVGDQVELDLPRADDQVRCKALQYPPAKPRALYGIAENDTSRKRPSRTKGELFEDQLRSLDVASRIALDLRCPLSLLTSDHEAELLRLQEEHAVLKRAQLAVLFISLEAAEDPRQQRGSSQHLYVRHKDPMWRHRFDLLPDHIDDRGGSRVGRIQHSDRVHQLLDRDDRVVDLALQATIRKCFEEFQFPESMKKEYQGFDRFLPMTYKETWKPLRDVAEKSGTPYNKTAYDALQKRDAETAAKKAAAPPAVPAKP